MHFALLGQQMCFLKVMKHKNDVSDVIGFLQLVKIYSLLNETKLYNQALYIVFFFVELENINFTKRIKYILRAFIS